MSLETFTRKRMCDIITAWLDQFDDSVCFVTEELDGAMLNYPFKLTILAIDKEVTE